MSGSRIWQIAQEVNRAHHSKGKEWVSYNVELLMEEAATTALREFVADLERERDEAEEAIRKLVGPIKSARVALRTKRVRGLRSDQEQFRTIVLMEYQVNSLVNLPAVARALARKPGDQGS